MVHMKSMSFDEWMDEIDSLCWDKFGVSINDFPDMLFIDRFSEGYAPAEFVDLEMMNETEDIGYYDFFE